MVGVTFKENMRFTLLFIAGCAIAAFVWFSGQSQVHAATVITTPSQLDDIRSDLDGDYELGGNINMSGYDWQALGIPNGDSFTGTFDGKGYTISNLTIKDEDGPNTGLFGHTTDATIKNVHLTGVNLMTEGAQSAYPNGALIGTAYHGTTIDNVSVEGSLTTRTITGGIVGSLSAQASMNNAHSDINIAAEDYTYSFDTGGVVGTASGDVTNSSSKGTIVGSKNVGGLAGTASKAITDSHSSANIIVSHPENEYISSWENIGGLVGKFSGSELKRSYATGMVDAEANKVGGLVGTLSSNSKVVDSYAQGDVTGTNNVGGLVGVNEGATVARSYASGSVSGSSATGGLIGSDSNGVYNQGNNYYDSTTTNQSDAKGATGKATAEMQKRSTFEGWNFTATWKVTPNNYPELRDEPFNVLTDISSSYWGRDDVTEIYEAGIMSGSADSSNPGKFVFRPNNDITRAEFAIVIVNALGENATGTSTGFTDDSAIPSWAKAEVAKAKDLGIVEGDSNGKFNPSNKISRAEIAVMIARAYDLPIGGFGGPQMFEDEDQIPAWAQDEVAATVAQQIMGGQESGGKLYFAPADQAMRVEAGLSALRAYQAN